MRIDDIKKTINEHKAELKKKYNVSQIGIFGSYVRSDQTSTSDIDILVDFSAPISLFEFIDMEEELSNLLHMRVDLVSKKALKPYIGKHILEEVQIV